MSLEHPVIAVIGAGAIGAYYGGRLAEHGHEVHFLLRGDYDAVKARGWTIRSCDGDFTLPPQRIHVYREAREMPRADLVVVTLKSTANDQFEKLVGPVMKERTTILTLQNGLGNEEELARLFGIERVLGGMAFVCINRLAPGEVHHSDHGLIRIGSPRRGPDARLDRISAMFNASGVKCEVTEDLALGRWTKLVWNIPFNGLSAILDRTTDELLADAESERLVREIMREVVIAARGSGVELPSELIEKNIIHTRSMNRYRTSTQVDRQMGRPFEVEAIFGRPLRVARQAGIETPRLEMLYQMIRLIDPGRP